MKVTYNTDKGKTRKTNEMTKEDATKYASMLEKQGFKDITVEA